MIEITTERVDRWRRAPWQPPSLRMIGTPDHYDGTVDAGTIVMLNRPGDEAFHLAFVNLKDADQRIYPVPCESEGVAIARFLLNSDQAGPNPEPQRTSDIHFRRWHKPEQPYVDGAWIYADDLVGRVYEQADGWWVIDFESKYRCSTITKTLADACYVAWQTIMEARGAGNDPYERPSARAQAHKYVGTFFHRSKRGLRTAYTCEIIAANDGRAEHDAWRIARSRVTAKGKPCDFKVECDGRLVTTGTAPRFIP